VALEQVFRRRLLGWREGLFAFVACLSASCASRQPTRDVIIRSPQAVRVPILNAIDGRPTQAIAVLPEIAVLASLAYEPPSAGTISCNGEVVNPGSWRSLNRMAPDSFVAQKPAYKLKIPGLSFRVFERRVASGRREFALVFRGTNFDSPADWYSNGRWITRFNLFTWDQYQQARALTGALEEELEGKYGPDFDLIAVGHSLGGGLAQQASYVSARLRIVFAFNTSPVTGATSIDQKNTAASRKGDTLHRIYESGEVLSGIRWASRTILPQPKTDPNIIEYRFNFRTSARGGSGGGAIGQHAMRQVACDLVCRVGRGKSPRECGTRLE
jgi:hypothetical protein